ncbi:MAG: S24/S26 family peptidase [Syntrophomonas sp.]
MDEIKIKATCLFPLICEIISYGRSARLPVTGSSMYPFLRDGIDSVELTKNNFRSLSRGDIVLICRNDGTYVMHRVLQKKIDCFFIVGDAQQWIEGPLFPGQLVAIVTAIWRKDKRILCTHPLWKILSEIWLLLRPYRRTVLNVYRIIRRHL